MTLIPVELPPGMYKNGTDYSARGRWADGNLVRWHNQSLRPVGGWQLRRDENQAASPALLLDPETETIRDALPYTTNAGSSQAVFASNKQLYLLRGNQAIVPITDLPGFEPGNNKIVAELGFGIGPFGIGPYGVARPPGSWREKPVQRWALDTWGENVLAAGVRNGPIFEITPSGSVTVLDNAPDEVQDVITTDQRIVMVLDNDPETRVVRWSDREDNNEWTPSTTNFAGSIRLQGAGDLVSMHKVLGQILILSETDAHVGRYIGAPFVYGFDRVADNCGPISPKAVAVTDRFAMWLGDRTFYMYDGTVRQVPCDVMDHIAATLSPSNRSKIFTLTITEYTEIWWFYQGKDDTEVSHYVSFDYAEGHWQVGRLDRTAGMNAGLFEYPIMVNSDGELFDHELDFEPIVDYPVYALSGPVELQNGNRNVAVRYIFPDTQEKDSVSLTLKTRQMPTEDDYVHGPFDYRNPISTTGVLGREVRMQVTGIGAGWEVGAMRWDVEEAGGGFR